jgi:glycosyltransferase involved in cell wall biosynthesis
MKQTETIRQRAIEPLKIAFIVHSFNRKTNIDKLARGLKRLGELELIVCDDGSIDGSRENWMTHLDRQNDYLVLSNDLHEIRILDRAINFSSAEIVCIVQDDDTMPVDERWLEDVIHAFERHPNLAIVGGFMGFNGFDTDPGNVRRFWGKMPFQFVEHVNIGPYFVRKSSYQTLGGWDYSFSKVGEPGICFDNELCLRAWSQGFQVGYLFVPFKGQPGSYTRDGGTVLFSSGKRRINQLRNERKILQRYGPKAERISQLVKNANLELANNINKSNRANQGG